MPSFLRILFVFSVALAFAACDPARKHSTYPPDIAKLLQEDAEVGRRFPQIYSNIRWLFYRERPIIFIVSDSVFGLVDSSSLDLRYNLLIKSYPLLRNQEQKQNSRMFSATWLRPDFTLGHTGLSGLFSSGLASYFEIDTNSYKIKLIHPNNCGPVISYGYDWNSTTYIFGTKDSFYIIRNGSISDTTARGRVLSSTELQKVKKEFREIQHREDSLNRRKDDSLARFAYQYMTQVDTGLLTEVLKRPHLLPDYKRTEMQKVLTRRKRKAKLGW